MITVLGRNPVLESLRASQDISDVYLKEGLIIDVKIREIIDICKTEGIRYKFVTKTFLDKLADGLIHQGIVATKREKPIRKLEEILSEMESKIQTPFVVYIREAQNEFNVGGIIRSAECAGANLIILPPKTHLTPQMVRASMGASEHIEIINENLFNTIKTVQKWAVRVIGVELTGQKYYFEEDLRGPVLFIVGGEDRSLSAEVSSKCDSVVKIPQFGKVNSLNMGVAIGIVLFEKVKQDKF